MDSGVNPNTELPRVRPVSVALGNFARLLESLPARPDAKLPSERTLAAKWGVSQAAVNRAAALLIAQGRLRRSGYALLPVASASGHLQGARIALLTHRSQRFSGVATEAAQRGVQVAERFFVGRDSLRHQLLTVIAERFDGVAFRLSDGGWEWDAEGAEMDRLGMPFVVAEAAPVGVAIAAEDWADATGQLVSHLAAEGHREIALIGSLRRAHRSNVVRHAYEERCLRLRLGKSAARVVELVAHTDEAVTAACRLLRDRHAGTTALVVYDEDHIDAVLPALRSVGWGVPDRISVVCVGDGPHARNARPSVTSAQFDPAQLGCLVLDQLCRMIRLVRSIGRTPARPRVLLGAAVQRRSSVVGRGRGEHASDEEGLLNRTSRVWSRSEQERRRQVEALVEKAHPLATQASGRDFVPLDLRPLTNRSLNRQNGWLGQFPLLHLPVGKKVIHGVPFDLIDERGNAGRAAIVLKGMRTGRAEPAQMVSVAIPVGARVRALYFLQGCGFVGTPGRIAVCTFKLRGAKPATLALVARGLGAVPKSVGRPNLQDWWSDFPQIEGPGVLPMVVTENGDPHSYERYLYSLEWRAPRGGAFVESVRIEAVEAQPAVLGLLALTALLATD
jgi:DNA-binding LacI/PurR family transcriptional regulator